MVASRIDAVARSFAAVLAAPPGEQHHPSFVTQLAMAHDRARSSAVDRPLGRLCASPGGCSHDTVCRDGVCRCAPGWDACGTDHCHFLPMSHAHCGGCGRPCGHDQLCSNAAASEALKRPQRRVGRRDEPTATAGRGAPWRIDASTTSPADWPDRPVGVRLPPAWWARCSAGGPAPGRASPPASGLAKGATRTTPVARAPAARTGNAAARAPTTNARARASSSTATNSTAGIATPPRRRQDVL